MGSRRSESLAKSGTVPGRTRCELRLEGEQSVPDGHSDKREGKVQKYGGRREHGINRMQQEPGTYGT